MISAPIEIMILVLAMAFISQFQHSIHYEFILLLISGATICLVSLTGGRVNDTKDRIELEESYVDTNKVAMWLLIITTVILFIFMPHGL